MALMATIYSSHNVDGGASPRGLVATTGVFDGVHRGHRHLLDTVTREALKRGLGAAVVTFDNHPSQVLAPDRRLSLLMTLDDKLRTLREYGIDNIFVLHFTRELSVMSSRDFITMLHRDYGVEVLVAGFNHRFGHDGGDVDSVADLPVEIVRAGEYAGPEAPVSSSVIRRLLAEGDVVEAARKLGRRYRVAGRVGHGRRNGTAIGFPTANVTDLDPALALPAVGAYAVTVTLDDGTYGGMAAIGYRPTVDHSARPALSVEVNIFDYDGDLYGHRIALSFVERLRDERRMTDLDQLRRQLTDDRRRAEALLTSINSSIT